MSATPVLPAYDAGVGESSSIPRGVAERIADLQDTVAELETVVATQRRIGVVVGIFAARYGCGTDRAWEMVAELSQLTDVEVADLASVLLDVFDGGAVDPGDAGLLAVLADRLPGGSLDRRRPLDHRRLLR